jgi:hypothetical protein
MGAGSLLRNAATIGGLTRAIVAILNGVTSLPWISGTTVLGAALAIVAEIVDQALFQKVVKDRGNRSVAASATVVAYFLICLMVVITLDVFILY